ncbi:MAG: TolC family protein [Deltaproteobacteria bacterium]|nr:TolC family protein [Deltaproteobacteria bacterium]
MRNKLLVLAAVAVFLASGVTHAQQTNESPSSITLSVEEAVMQALQNNGELSLRRLQPQIAGAFAAMERGEYDPSLFGNASHSRDSATRTYAATGEMRAETENQTEFEVGIEQRAPTGTAVTATVSSARRESSRTGILYNARLGISITQQLLKGLPPKVNLANVHRADLEVKISEHEFAAFAEALVAEVETAYWQYVSAKESVRVVENAVAASKAKLLDIQERVAVGDVPLNDAAAAAAELGMREQRLLLAQKAEMERRLALFRLLYPNHGTPLTTPIRTLSPLTPPVTTMDSVDDHVTLALSSRQELMEARLRRRQGVLELTVSRNGVLPKLELFVTLGKTGYADTFADSFSNLNDSTHDAALGVRFRHVLGNRKAQSQRTIASLNVASAKQAIENLQQLVKYDVYAAWNALDSAQKLVTVTKQTQMHRETALRSVQARVEVGTATGLELVQAERDLLESALEEVNAQVQYQLAQVQLYKAEGTLLKRRGIGLE